MADESGWYGGIGIGKSREWNHHPRITNQLLGSGLITNSISDDSRDTGYKLFAGKKINKNFAVEAGYFDLGKFGFTATTTPPGSLTGTIKLRGVNADVLGIVPITEKFSAFGRLGVQYAQAKDTFRGTGAVAVLNPSPSKSDTNIKYGVGVQYDFTDSLAMRGEWERYRINDAVGNRGNIDMLLVGLVYTFGGDKSAPAPREATPAPVYVPPPAPVAAAPAPAPEAPPPVVVAPAPIVLRQVSFSADSLFDYDKAEVKPAGRQHLDKLAADLKGTTFDVINVTGHTDRIGSSAYNQKLSTRRAESVKTYLVQSGGIPAAKIAAKGAGKSNPVTKPADCKGAKVTPSLKACLQQDRRVEVAVSGTR
jgi:OOP family OmpA-OmpF porin